jgi:hypothetical protein
MTDMPGSTRIPSPQARLFFYKEFIFMGTCIPGTTSARPQKAWLAPGILPNSEQLCDPFSGAGLHFARDTAVTIVKGLRYSS